MPKSDPEFTASAMAACPAARARGIRAASEAAGVSDPDRGRWPCHWRNSAASRSQGGASPASPPSWRCSTRTAAPARSTVSKEKGSGEEQSTSSPDASRLSENEVDKMVKEAEANVVAGMEKHEKTDLKNQAETSIHQSERRLEVFCACGAPGGPDGSGWQVSAAALCPKRPTSGA